MGVEKIILNPWEFVWIDFVEGRLNVLGSEEQRIHSRASQLHYGKKSTADSLLEYKYVTPLQDLKKMQQSCLMFHKINCHTEARRTISGGLQLRRKAYCVQGFSDTATFSHDGYRIIQRYLEGEMPTTH